MEFEWDKDKAAGNVRKHKVSFDEAATVFADTLSSTFADPDHSVEEDRYVTIGLSDRGRVLIVSHTNRGDRLESLAPALRRVVKETPMKKKAKRNNSDRLRKEYDPALIRGGVRGKYAQRYKAGTNLVLLAPDVAAAFPDA